MPDRGDGRRRVTDITTPSLLCFPVVDPSQPAPAIILCPGGAYKYVVVSKMTEIAAWLNDNGISAFVLKYRTPQKREEAFQDVQRAIRIVRSRASEWNLDPNRVGVMGSSAGGHLAARVSTGFDIKTYPAVDQIDRVSCRPDFTVLLYPAYMNKNRKSSELAQEFAVSRDLGSTLIIVAKDDPHFKGSVVYSEALKDAGASVRVQFFNKGGHGFGLRPNNQPLSAWPDLCLEWLTDVDILSGKAE